MRTVPVSKAIPGRRQPPMLLGLRSSTPFIVATIWMSTFTDFLLYAMVNFETYPVTSDPDKPNDLQIVPVMPTALVTRAGVEYKDREYWVSVLLMCEAGTALLLCPVFGYLIDSARTRRLPFLGALILLAGCMGVLHVSRSLAMFVAGRLLQGCAGALVVVAAFALINDSVPQENLGQTIGYLGSAIASGFLLGPFLGGLVYHAGGYDAVFWVAYGIIAVDFGMRVAMIENGSAERWESSSANNGGGGLQAEVVVRPDRLEELPRSRVFVLLRMLTQRRVLVSSWALLVHGILLSAFDATLAIFVESRYEWSAFGMGLIFLPMAIPAFFEPFFGYFTDRCGARFVAFTCFFLLSPSLISLRFVEPNDPPHIALLVILLFLIGVFIHACAPAMYVETQLALSEMERARHGSLGSKDTVAQGFGVQSMCQFAGMFLGPLWGGFVEYRFGWGAMSGTLGVLAALTAMPMLWLGEGIEWDEEEEGEHQALLHQ
ncbi:hypothetical protein N7510_009873 [Penicillium lagena]|uniref:uncharacterized protein n=1 Tax=Penicillium lagena TaxID=94218 RepID=UPI0025406720|nr:uncharacterized protein N7510_009873 [Penicillium lagena]KAJ5604719.1 hypothetical protein N7510_009873 [Penicillium lagena]